MCSIIYLYFLLSQKKKELDKKYNRYNFKIPEEQAPVIGKKSGEDYNYKKQPQTIREFCDDENS